jgi:hypothetical protein
MGLAHIVLVEKDTNKSEGFTEAREAEFLVLIQKDTPQT